MIYERDVLINQLTYSAISTQRPGTIIPNHSINLFGKTIYVS